MAASTPTIAATAIALISVVAVAPRTRMIPVETWRVMVTRTRAIGSVLDNEAGSKPTEVAVGTSTRTVSLVRLKPFLLANRQGVRLVKSVPAQV